MKWWWSAAALCGAAVLCGATAVAGAQTVTTTYESETEEIAADGFVPMARALAEPGVRGDAVGTATFKAKIAELGEGAQGTVYLRFSLRAAGVGSEPPLHVTVQVPMASTAEAHGEERSCTVDAEGEPTMVFTAGPDAANVVPFRATSTLHTFHFVLNTYLCSVLAAPFTCGGKQVSLPRSPAAWTMGERRQVVFRSDRDTQMEGTAIEVETGGHFDAAQCQLPTPSSGVR